MATLVLNAIGTALGGPIGGAIGSLIGYSIDQQIFGGGPRKGPRLGDLSIQTSTYGTPMPRIYGTMRVAGSVIWATELKETSSRQGGGKGQPELVTYNYSVSMAVALSSRHAADVRRIWADGKLLRGAAGDFKVQTQFRFVDGTEDQPVDPLISSIEGIGQGPAYRGLAVAIFEDLELAEYGNRIPFLTFEVEADAGPQTLGTIITDMSGGHVDCRDPRELAGYAAHGTSIRGAMEPLVEHFGIELGEQGSRIRSPQAASHIVRDDDLGSSAGVEKAARWELTQVPARQLPGAITLSYYDPDRDYQTGQARASIGTADAQQERGEIPAAMGSAAAKALAESALARRWIRRDRLTLRLPPAFMSVAPGDRLQVESQYGEWRVERSAIEGLATVLEIRGIEAWSDSLPADPGRPQPDADRIVSPTVLALFDLPDLGLQTPRLPELYLAAANGSENWRAVPIEIAISGVTGDGQTALAETILGTSLGTLGAGQSCLLDLVNPFEVELVDEDHWLESCDDIALVQGANIAVLGYELLQFGLAEPIGARRFRLSRLLRGRRGSEWAMAGHVAGETFALLQPGRLRPIGLSPAQVGATVEVTAHGLGDGAGTMISRTAAGESFRPPSPVRLGARPDAGGGLILSWVRRSRDGWAWLDGIDAPMGESSELYRVRIEGVAGTHELETSTPEAIVSDSELASIGAGAALVSVAQIGDFAPSRAATLSISIS